MSAATLQALSGQLSDWRWRLSNLYWIADKQAQPVIFQPNAVQLDFLNSRHGRDIILKSRQHGMSTLIDLVLLDAALFNDNMECGIIAHTKDAVLKIFQTKVKHPYDHLPEEIKAMNPARQDAAHQLTFANGSSIRVGTSMRSGTLQMLHVSEHGKICAQFPDKAREIRTGSLPTVPITGNVWIESTAEGQEGDFYDMCQDAQTMARDGSPLGPLDFKFHFYAWWQDEGNRLPPVRPFTQEERDYFDKLEREDGIVLDNEQKAWYCATAKTQRDDMKREHPSTPEEAFAASIEGAFYAHEFIRIDETQRIVDELPVRDQAKVDTWWDLGIGVGNEMAIWFVQRDGPWFHVLDYYENSGYGLAHYAEILSEKREKRGFVYGRHMWPHDGGQRVLDEHGRKRNEIMAGLGYSPQIVERGNVMDGIEAVRDVLSSCKFDRRYCDVGIKRLRHYRREWDEDRSAYRTKPYHDANSNGADAFRTGAMAKQGEGPDWSRPAYKVGVRRV